MKSVKRLISQFIPERYDLTIAIDKESRTFSGIVSITGKKTGRPSQRFTFHQKGLKIISAEILHIGKKETTKLVVDRINNHTKFDEVRLHTSDLARAGHYRVVIHFEGKITEAMNGIYPCNVTENGKKETIIATQFESHHAREAFPCIDEPEAKAIFQLTLHTGKEKAVLSNTPQLSQQKMDKQLITVFEPTPKMSTYLLAFVIGNLTCLSGMTKNGVCVRSYATPGNTKYTAFALETALRCLDFYDSYFGIPYPLKNCDLIALPDFASGAMENWGCITFREQALLVDPSNTSLPMKQYVALVIAHELAHQWFGNLVTMRWWTDLWLNEGFASWIEYLAVDALFPDWNIWTQFIVDEQQPAFKLDALEHTHPIEVEINHPDEIRTIFDSISYNKGASVIRMLHSYIGEDAFKKGLRYYLETNAYGNTNTVDLWDALSHVSKKDVKEFMHAWTTTSGFPVVTVRKINKTIQLEQQRFYINQSASRAAQIWPVPTLAANSNIPVLLQQKASIPYNQESSVLLNSKRSGFYRVAYDPDTLKKISHAVVEGQIDEIDRLSILSDSFETAKSGLLSTSAALDLLNAYKNERSYVVWEVMAESLSSVRSVMDEPDIRKNIKPYTRRLVAKELERLGVQKHPDDDHFSHLLRPVIVGMAAAADNQDVVSYCLKAFAARTGPKKTPIDPDLRPVVYNTVARKGADKDFNNLLTLHNSSSSSEERIVLASALTGFRQENIIDMALKCITSSSVRLQDASYWIAYSFMNRHAKDQTWIWLKSHWEWLEAKLGDDLSFYRMPIYAARVFHDTKFLKEYDSFFDTKSSPGLKRSINQGREMIQWQTAWHNTALDEVRGFFMRQAEE